MCPSRRLGLNVVRDSVCARDDVEAPHAACFVVEAGATLADVLSMILGARYLAGIAGGRATWIVESDKPLAVVAQQWVSPRFLIDPATRFTDCLTPSNPEQLRFRYWCQADPDEVLACLRAGRPLPGRYSGSR